jgi:hypothetical protein
MLTGAASRLEFDAVAGHWRLKIEATQHVTVATVLVWEGTKPTGNDPAGTYTKVAGCDPASTLTIEAL